MKVVHLSVEEKLTYRRHVEVLVPNDMTDSKLEKLLDKAQREEMLDDFLHILTDNGIEIITYDNDLSCPDNSEVECDDYEFIQEVEV